MALTRVAIVGAGGFVGTTLLAVISKVPDCEAIAVIRHPRTLPLVLGLSDAVVVTEGRADIMADAFSRCDAVIDVSFGRASEILTSALKLAEACQKAGVKRLIYTSSAAAQTVQRHRWSTSRPPSYYGREKLRAEETLLSRLTETELAVIRPGLIWGPRSSWSIRHVTEIARGAVTAPIGEAGNASAPNLAFSGNLAAKMLAWALSEAAGGRYYFADPWWASWEDYFLALASTLEISSSDVVVARKLRSGPPSRLLFEFLSNHPETARRAKQFLVLLPEQAVAMINAGLRPPIPPPANGIHALGVSPTSTPTTVDTGWFASMDVDVFSRWAEPTPQFDDSDYPQWVDKEQALRQTVSWLSASGYLDYLGIEVPQP